MSQVNVTSLEPISEFRTALGQFCGETQQTLDTVNRQIRRFQEWLEDRQRYWRQQVEDAQEAIFQARRALEQCRASGYYDTKTGTYYAPDCSAYEQEVAEAYRSLRRAEDELQNVIHWQRVIAESVADYQRQAIRLTQQIQQDIPKAGVFLGRKLASIEAYQTENLSSSVSTPTFEAALTTPPPDLLAAMRFEFMLNMTKLSALSKELTSLLIHGIDWLAANPEKRIKGNVGEELAVNLLQNFGFQEIPFDQPYHGFDRIFSAPDLPIVIIESKVNQRGVFHLGKTKDGEQGSPEWIAAHIEKMLDPNSSEYSEQNKRIAQLIQSTGAKHVPVIAVVNQSKTGNATLYYRAAGSDEWKKWDGKARLYDALCGMEHANGIQLVPVRDLLKQIRFEQSHVKSKADFQKVSYEMMAEGFRKLQNVILPAMQKGADGDEFSRMDAEQGLPYEHGHRRVYDAFYGDEPIRVEKQGEKYTVINGYHRLFVANEIGLETVPAQLVERSS